MPQRPGRQTAIPRRGADAVADLTNLERAILQPVPQRDGAEDFVALDDPSVRHVWLPL